MSLFFFVFTGLLFPLAITGIARAAFPWQAEGSLIRDPRGNVVGSALVGQSFTRPEYFHGRPSAAGEGYDGSASGGTNLGPTSKKLIEGEDGFDGLRKLAADYRRENGLPEGTVIPADAVTRSGSGLDPHISLRNAELQAPRVAKARGVSIEAVRQAIRQHTVGTPEEEAVNVLQLNMALDGK